MKTVLNKFMFLLIIASFFQGNLLCQASDPDKLGLELLEALKSGDVSKVSNLIKAGASVNLQDDRGNTALMLASSTLGPYGGSYTIAAFTDIVELLLNNGAEPNLQSNVGDTALISASAAGHKDIVKLLLEKGIDISLQNTMSDTALTTVSDFEQDPAFRQDSDFEKEEIFNILQLETAIKEGRDLEPYIDKLNEEDLWWFLNRAITNQNIEKLLPQVYKDLVVIYKRLKGGNIPESQIINILSGKDSISEELKIKKIEVYEKLMNDLFQILYLHKVGILLDDDILESSKESHKKRQDIIEKIKSNNTVMPLDVAAKTVLEY